MARAQRLIAGRSRTTPTAHGIGREIGDTIARADSEPLQNRRPTIASIEKLRVTPARLTVDHGDLFRIMFPCAASQFEWRQRVSMPAKISRSRRVSLRPRADPFHQ